ncbi:MAG: type 1 glutamine amidotransferase [Pseudomonadota bacterium]
MRIAILMANTDESAFAERHPRDDEKFTSLMTLVRPDWSYPVFSVKDAEFPKADQMDGAIITGSPASVHDEAWWMIRLGALVKEMYHTGIPVFGACFGHQLIARALGGQVGPNPQGWVKGVVTVEYADQSIAAYASHTEQVLDVPPGADAHARAESCEIAGFRLGTLIETTQYHPEMTEDFFCALLEEYGPDLPADVVARARASLSTTPSRALWAEHIARFFEAHAKSMATDPKAP